jgi:serine/threonine protein kinase/tetratricopeptide (TPR) repeat protein
MIGKTISHYKILEKLGGGGMGVVYKAEDTRLKRTVALKFLPPVFSFDQEAKKRFINEAQTASSLQHHNICNIHDIDETKDGQIFICMDCYEGETLKKKIERGQIKNDEAIDIIVQVAAGLQKAHEKGIIHRDLKPANIFITNDGVVKILDFGLAKLSGQTMMTKMGETVGTIAYMSPEQTRGELVDQRTDIWSLGVVLYEMLTRNLPFKGDYDSAMIYSILNEEPNHLSDMQTDVPKEFQQIIDKCLSKNPSERHQSIDEMLDDLKKQKIIEGSGTITRTFVRKKKSRKLFYSISGIIILAVLVVAIWMFLPKGRPDKSEKSRFIAVLPFHPITSSEEDKNFAEGIHDDILTQLAKIRDLRVIARTSVMHYQNTQKTIKEIASELGVGVILEGSTRRVGNTLRITAQLIDAETEEHLWADSYDRPYTDIFNIQSDVAKKIASALQIKLAKEELAEMQTIPTDNMEAWEYFQKGKYYWYNYFDFDGHLKSAQMFEKACELDTNFALAYAWQALEYMVVYSRSDENKNVYLNKYKIAIQKAEAFQPIIPEVNIAKGVYFYNAKNDLVEALKEGEIANSKRPNDPFILMQLGNFYLDNRNYLKALELYEKAFELDPRSIKIPVNASTSALALDRFNEAERWTDIVIANSPETSVGYEYKLDIIINVRGDLKSAEELLEDAKKNVTMEKFRLAYWDFLISFYKRDYSKSLIQNEKIVYWWKLYNEAYLLKLLNRDREARVYFDSLRIVCQQFFKNQPNAINAERTINLALAYAGLGERTKALNEIVKLDSTTIIYNSRDLAYFYIMLGDNNSALQSLQNTISATIRLHLGELNLDPLLDPLRSDPRFKKIIAAAEERIKKAKQ